MNATLFDWLVSRPSSASLADEIANAGQSAVDLLNQATGNLGKLGDQIGNSQVSGAWTASSGYTPVQIPATCPLVRCWVWAGRLACPPRTRRCIRSASRNHAAPPGRSIRR